MANVVPTPETDAEFAATVMADAQRRLAMLQRLAVLGMVIAEEITQRMVDSPYHPEPAHEPARAFAQVSRAVRLTLVLEAKMQTRIITLRKEGVSAVGAATVGPAPWAPLSEKDRRDLTRPRRQASDRAAEETLVEQTRESLSESEGDSRLAGDFRAAVETICSNLGLDPDWSRWPEDKDAVLVPLIPMLTEFLATAAAPAVVAECRHAETADHIAGPDSLETHPPPET